MRQATKSSSVFRLPFSVFRLPSSVFRFPSSIFRLPSLLVLLLLAGPGAQAANQPPQIQHAPVTAAVRGQAVTVRANLRDDGGAVRAVNLYCSPSRDAAPFKIPMQAVAPGVFSGTIPATMLAENNELFYYLEAIDEMEAAAETPWHTIKVRALGQADPAPPGGAPGLAPAQGGAAHSDTARSWKKPALLAGTAALLVGGAAVALSGGGGDGGSGGVTNAVPGTYVGSATTCRAPPGGGTSCENSGFTLTVTAAGAVRSDDLRPGQSLQGTLSGGAFSFTAPVDGADGQGEIVYTGEIRGEQVFGNLRGSASGAAGTTRYSGTFSASRP